MRLPHTFMWSEVSETHDGFRVDVPVEGTPIAIRCQITPTTAEAVMRNYGIELVNGYLMLTNVPNARNLAMGDRGAFDGRKFQVVARPKIWNAGISTNCTEILLEEVTF